MNILYLTSGLEMGGTELFALDLAKESIKHGHRVVWGTVKAGGLKKFVSEQGIELVNCHLQRRPFPRIVSAIIALKRTVKKYNIDIIHSADVYSALISCLAFGRRKKCPKLVWTNVGIGINSYGKIKKLCEPYLDAITTETNYIRNRLLEAGFEPEKIFVCYRCRPMKEPMKSREEIRKELKLEDDDFLIGSMGRLAKPKGNHTIISALPSVLKEHPNVKFLIVGDGIEKKNLIDLAHRLNMQDRVIFYGFSTDVAELYNAMDAVVFPTYYEALGHICFEAMHYKKPLIASCTGGILETVTNNVNGLLVPPAKTEEWAYAIKRIINEPQLRRSLVENGVEFMKNMENQNQLATQKILDIYGRLLMQK